MMSIHLLELQCRNLIDSSLQRSDRFLLLLPWPSARLDHIRLTLYLHAPDDVSPSVKYILEPPSEHRHVFFTILHHLLSPCTDIDLSLKLPSVSLKPRIGVPGISAQNLTSPPPTLQSNGHTHPP